MIFKFCITVLFVYFTIFSDKFTNANTTMMPLYLMPLKYAILKHKNNIFTTKNESNLRTNIQVSNTISYTIASKNVSGNSSTSNNKIKTPVKLSMKQGLLMNQVLGFYVIENSTSELCRKHSQEFKSGLRNFEPWALQMFDSNSKLQSGILYGNLFEFGSYVQCLEIQTNATNVPLYGKHCSLRIVPSLELIEKIVSFKNVSKKRFSIIKIIVEKAELGWSVCVPHSCPINDIQQHFKKKIFEISEGLDLSIHLDQHYCRTKHSIPKMLFKHYLILVFLSSFIILSLITGYIDFTCGKGLKENTLITIFSAYTNLKKITAHGIIQPEFNFIHGLRFLSTCYVVLGHRYIMFMVDPTINSLGILDWVLQFPSSLILGSTVSVDSFFMISGMLLSVGFFGTVTKTGKFNLFLFYLHRYLRISLPLGINLIIWCWLVQFLGDGTLMYNVFKNHQKNCQDYWWSTLLHIQTYVNPGKWCNYPIWYLSCEMMFYYVSPILLYPLWKWPIFGIIFCILTLCCSIGLSFYLAWENRYTGDTLPVTSELLVTDYFKYYYTQPHVRISPYIIGILFGYIIFRTKNKKIVVRRSVNIILWIISISIMLITIFGSRTFQLESHDYNVWESASYLAFSRSAWTLCLVWIIWSCLNGYGGLVNSFLSTHTFRVLSRISYSVFLFHTIIQLYMGGNMKVSLYFSNFYAIYYAVSDICITTMVGFLFTIFYEIPLVRAETVFFNPKKVSSIPNKKSNQ